MNNAIPNEIERQTAQKLLPWRFWFTVVFSLFLVVTFGLYLPLRFQHQGEGEMRAHVEKTADGMLADHHAATRYHEEGEVREGLAVNLNVTPVPVAIGTTTRLDFFVNEKPGNVPVPVSELELEHAKLMHVIGVRNDMNEFFHIHPQPTYGAGILTVDHIFDKPGLYKIWSEVKRDGANHAFGHPEVRVDGIDGGSKKEISFGRSAIVDQYQVLLSVEEPIAKGVEAELHFDIRDLFGREVAVEPYLDAEMHLAIIKEDLTHFIHAHPESGVEDHRGAFAPMIAIAFAHGPGEEAGASPMIEDADIHFRVTLPEAGLYKLFAQFRPQGTDLPLDEALLAAFWVEVKEKSPAAIPAWWRNLLVSAVAIAALSLGVRRFLRVHEI